MEQLGILKLVSGYEGLYEVSNTGKIRSIERMTVVGRRGSGRELRQYLTPYGYLEVSLSNKGEDFRTVLEELIKIVEPTAVMPAVPKNGWPCADSYCGDGWSLAYRTYDAQYWGVPQRRRRIYLVLDLRGQRAREVLFEREGLRRNFAKSGTPWKAVAGDAADRTGADDCDGECVAYSFDSLASNSMKSKNPYSGCRRVEIAKTLDTTDPNPCKNQGGIAIVEPVPYTLKIRSGCEGGGKGALIQLIAFAQNQRDEVRDLKDKAGALAAEPGMKQQTFIAVPNILLEAAGFKAGQSMAGGIGWQKECAATLAAQCSGTEPTVCVKCYDARGNGDGQTVSTLTGDHENRITDYTSVVCMATQQGGAEIMENLCPTITASAGMSGNNQPVVCMAHGQAKAEILEDKSPCLNCNHEQPIIFDKEVYNSGVNAAGGHYIAEGGPSPTLRTSAQPGVCVQYIVRRLTPTECAMLQGFPDDWGHPDHKEDFTDEEYRFWLDVRNTHADINGKPQKEYTKAQMLTWYNKLHTDSAEYKMWGNGMAFPCVLYVMEGVKEEIQSE